MADENADDQGLRPLIVTKSNSLVEASYRLTLNEQRLVLAAIAMINSKDAKPGWELLKGRTMRVSAETFAKTYDVDRDTAYEGLKDACEKLYERSIKRIGDKAVEKFRWVSRVQYMDGQAFAEISWTLEILPYLTMLGKQFTSYELRQITGLSSSYSIRLYELLKQFSTTGKRHITVEKFREILDLKDLYPRYYDLKNRIINPSVRELCKHTDLLVEWDEKRQGRVVTSLHFTFQRKPQQSLDI